MIKCELNVRLNEYSFSLVTVEKNLVCALPIYAIVKIWFSMG